MYYALWITIPSCVLAPSGALYVTTKGRHQLFNFYRTQVNLGSDLWVRMSVTNKQTNYDTFVKLN